MEPKDFKRNRPEEEIVKKLKPFYEMKGWKVYRTHGSALQDGFPDLYITHKDYGSRWVEVKLPGMKGSQWTKAQRRNFPVWVNNGSPIWIITAATDQEYKKLFEKCNFFYYFIIKD